MIWSNSGSGRDKEEMYRIIDGTANCPEIVKSAMKSLISGFADGADVTFSSYGHINPDLTGNCHIDIVAREAPRADNVESAVTG